METVKMYRCQHCGGSLKFGPDDIIYTCPYCSYTAIIDGVTIKDHSYCPSITPKVAQKMVREFLSARTFAREDVVKIKETELFQGLRPIPSDLAEKAEIVESRMVYIPFWRVPIEAETKYRGQIVLKSKRARDLWGKRYIPVDRKISDHKDIYVLARRFASFYGLEEMKGRLGRPVSWQTVNLTQAKSEGEEFLNAEISEEEAYITAKNSVEDTHRSRAEIGVDECAAPARSKKDAVEVKATELLDCPTTVRTKRATYLHVPLFILRYRYKEKIYKVALDGTDGIVLKAELPITLHGRLRHLVLAFFTVIGAGLVGEGSFWLGLLALKEGELEGALAAGGIFISAFGLLLVALKFLKKFFKVEREYKGD